MYIPSPFEPASMFLSVTTEKIASFYHCVLILYPWDSLVSLTYKLIYLEKNCGDLTLVVRQRLPIPKKNHNGPELDNLTYYLCLCNKAHMKE